MFKWFKHKEIIIRDDVVQDITDLLFPEPIESADGENTYLTDYSVDMNLYSAIVDLEEGRNDEITRETLKSIMSKLGEVRDLLYANYKLKEKAQYLVVSAPGKPIEEKVSSEP